MTEKKRKFTYVEPIEYFPREVRRKYGFGEYSDEATVWDRVISYCREPLRRLRRWWGWRRPR